MSPSLWKGKGKAPDVASPTLVCAAPPALVPEPTNIGSEDPTAIAYYYRPKGGIISIDHDVMRNIYIPAVYDRENNLRVSRPHCRPIYVPNLANDFTPAAMPSFWVHSELQSFSQDGDGSNGNNLANWERFRPAPQGGATLRFVRVHNQTRPLFCDKQVGNSRGDIFGACDCCDHPLAFHVKPTEDMKAGLEWLKQNPQGPGFDFEIPFREQDAITFAKREKGTRRQEAAEEEAQQLNMPRTSSAQSASHRTTAEGQPPRKRIRHII